ncbi:hypothetical protein Tco_0616925 [Tanacetum coccineum]
MEGQSSHASVNPISAKTMLIRMLNPWTARSKRERYTDYDDETNVGVGLEEQVNALDDVDSDAEPVDCN